MPFASSNSRQERQRLGELYSRMNEGELRTLAEDAPSLTETAREVLRSELSRRGLPIDLQDSTAPDQKMELRELLTIRRFRDVPEALLARSILESAGIECILGDDNLVRIDWLLSNLLGGIKLRVRQEDAMVAAQLLDQSAPQESMVHGEGEDQQSSCPNCQSLEVSPHEVPDLRRSGSPGTCGGFKCQSCGFEWLDSGDPPTWSRSQGD
jgi:hypothetical protein